MVTEAGLKLKDDRAAGLFNVLIVRDNWGANGLMGRILLSCFFGVCGCTLEGVHVSFLCELCESGHR